MSIATNLERILASKDEIKNAIISKGVTVLDSDKIDVYADKIYQIQQGSEYTLSSLTITDDTEWRTQDNIVLSYVKADYSTFKNRIAELEEQIVDLNSQIADKQNKIEELQTKLDFDEDLLDDLRAEIETLEQEKSALENELNELRAKINSMTDLSVTENGTYTPEFGYKSVTVNVDTEKHIVTSKTISENGTYNSSGNEVWNKVIVDVPQTGVSEMQSLEVLKTGEYINQTIPYSSVTVSDTVFYKKYIDGDGNTYIINEDGEVIITYSGGTPPTPTTNEYTYITFYIPSDKAYETLTINYSVYTSEATEIYFDNNSFTLSEYGYFYLRNQPIEVNTYHTIKIKLVNDDNRSIIGSIINATNLTDTSGTVHRNVIQPTRLQFAYGATKAFISTSTVNKIYIKEIIIPDTVITISNLMQCGIEKIFLPNSVTSIDMNAFNSCSLTSVTIPNSVTTIGVYAFLDCSSLTTVTIGSGVTSIGDSSFGQCKSLNNITYNGTKTQFTAISKNDGWAFNVPTSCIVHCTDGDYPITDFT